MITLTKNTATIDAVIRRVIVPKVLRGEKLSPQEFFDFGELVIAECSATSRVEMLQKVVEQLCGAIDDASEMMATQSQHLHRTGHVKAAQVSLRVSANLSLCAEQARLI